MEVWEEDGLILPPGVAPGVLDGEPAPGSRREQQAVIDNRTDLPDELIMGAAQTYLEENSAYNLRNNMPMSVYNDGGGSMMSRAEFRSPSSIPDEIRLARLLAEKDDDIAAVIGEMIGLAFSDGVQVQHQDERTQALFEGINEEMDIEGVLANMYREWLIAGQVNTTMLFTREELDYELSDKERMQTANVAVPRVGVLASEQIRVLDNDIFGTAQLAYEPESEKLKRWLEEYFNPLTSPARKAELGRKDRVAANMFIGKVAVHPFVTDNPQTTTGVLYLLNPLVVQRTTMPKGAWSQPRPTMTRNFPLLEAKRLLNVMDFALLQGGSNFIVVAKKGTDQRPAKGQEVANLREVVKRASKVGLIVGDHRLSFEIITPKLDELLNAEKRKLLGRKMAMGLMRVGEHGSEDSGAEGQVAEIEMFSRVISWDRDRLIKHLERNIYKSTVKRNPKVLKSAANIWVMKLILQGTQYFNDMVLKMRDRGDISRRSAVQAAGFDYEAELGERERELAAGHDEILIPGVVPHTSPDQPGQTPQINDNGGGRPAGVKNGDEPGPRPKTTLNKVAGETIKAWFDEDADVDQVVRMGEETYKVLDAFPDRVIGRLTANDIEALRLSEAGRIGPTVYVPVNPGYEVAEARAVRLEDGLSLLVGQIPGGAIVAKAIGFREPRWTAEQAEETAIKWGFLTEALPDLDPLDPDEEVAAADGRELTLKIELNGGNEGGARMLIKDKDGQIIGSQLAVDPPPKDD